MRTDAHRSRLFVNGVDTESGTESRVRPRVLVVGQGPPTRGGIPTFVSTLLADSSLRARAELRYLNTTPQRAKLPGAFAPSNLVLVVVHAFKVLRFGRGCDVVHLNLAATPLLPLIRAAALCTAARLAGCRVVLHAHTGEIPRCMKRRSFRIAMRAVLRLTDVMIVVANDAARALEGCGGHVVRLLNGVDVADQPVGPKADPPMVAFVGTVCERKGLIDLRDALSRLRTTDPDVRFTLAIVGDSAQEGPGVFERVRDRYSEVGLEARFLGVLDVAGVRDVLAASSIFCLPSHSEGFPIALLEGMAAGAAVVASDVGDIPDMLGGGEAGVLVRPRDIDSLHNALRELICDAERRSEMGRRARARVAARHDFRGVVVALLDIYLALTAWRSKGRQTLPRRRAS